MVREASRKAPVVLFIPKGSPEIQEYSLKGVQVLVLGRDVDLERLYELLRIVRELPEGALVVAIRLDTLFLKRPAKTVYTFLEDLASLIQEKKLKLLMTVEKRSISEKELAIFENISTHVIDITEIVSGLKILHLLRVKKSRGGGSGFYEMRVENGALHLYKMTPKE